MVRASRIEIVAEAVVTRSAMLFLVCHYVTMFVTTIRLFIINIISPEPRFGKV